ncbi:hypothetical protein Pmani_004169 [Petrolisthes manimaculis]|uniref:PHD-type domain-containing protein n=1 Tax=Petrolisthes manimaculis TaxID=1843537 RepID=A0AAE1QE53_9EUCA|nr:hypothetical protein Pmani_004169 [Petrolisthes manimaculis]
MARGKKNTEKKGEKQETLGASAVGDPVLDGEETNSNKRESDDDNNNGNCCGICESEVDGSDQAMQCEVCKQKYHIICEKMPVQVYEYLMKAEEQIDWYCTHCKKGSRNLHKYIKKVDERTTIMENKHSDLEVRVNAMTEIIVENQQISKSVEDRIGQVEAQIVEFKDQLDNQCTQGSLLNEGLGNLESTVINLQRRLTSSDDISGNSPVSYSEAIKKEAVPAMRDIMKQEMENLKKKIDDENNVMNKEYRDQEDKKNKIIIHGAPESRENECDKRREEDWNFLERFIQIGIEEVNIHENMIRKVVRIGKRNANAEKPRPMLVMFNTSYYKQDVLINTKNLKTKDEFKEIYVQHDMTVAQRNELKQLVSKAKKMEEEDKSGNIIYRVRGSPENLVIRKMKKQM